MGNFKDRIDFYVFKPVYADDGTIRFKTEDFENLIIAVESSLISEINEGKKTISGHAVEAIFKYIGGEAEVDEVIAELNNLKHQSSKSG